MQIETNQTADGFKLIRKCHEYRIGWYCVSFVHKMSLNACVLLKVVELHVVFYQ